MSTHDEPKAVPGGAPPGTAVDRVGLVDQGRDPQIVTAAWLAVFSCLLFLPTGVVALYWLQQAVKNQKSDRSASRIAVAKVRNWAWNSTTIFITLLILGFLALVLTTNDFAVYHTFFDLGVLGKYLGGLLAGFWINIQIMIIAWILILIWSTVVAVLREIPGRAAAPIRWMTAAYSDIFRGIPLILVLMIIGLGLPRSGLPVLSQLTTFQSAILALTLSYGAYMSEVIRGGIHAVHVGQASAARALGLSYAQSMVYVVLPQGIRNAVLPLLNGFIGLQKDSALVSVLGVLDAVNRAQAISSFEASLAPFTGIAIAYILITVPLTRYNDYLTAKVRKARLGVSQ